MEASQRSAPPPAVGRRLSRVRLLLRGDIIGAAGRRSTLLRWWLGWLWLLRHASPAASGAGPGSAQVVADLFRSLGATFIKVGQIMSTRPDLVPEHVTRALERLQDDVGPFPFAAVARTIEEDLGRPFAAGVRASWCRSPSPRPRSRRCTRRGCPTAGWWR